MMVDEFNGTFFGNQSLDEMLLRPREALRFCDNGGTPVKRTVRVQIPSAPGAQK
jgi:hypothetical protein